MLSSAGLVPSAKIIAVDGRTFSTDRLHAAIHDAKGHATPIDLILETESYVTRVALDYHDGERYPALERVQGTPAYLDDILKPQAQPRTPDPKMVGKDAGDE